MGKTITGIMLTLLLASIFGVVIHAMPVATTSVADAASVMVDVLIDYGNGTKIWNTGVALPGGATVFNATLAIATVNYTLWDDSVFIDAINGVWNGYPYYWIWWYWNFTESRWMIGPVACNFYTLNDGDIVAWYFEDCSVWPPPPPFPKRALIDIAPNSLNLRSEGRWITAYIELTEGCNVSDINISTILLNSTIPAELKPTAIGDYDDDGIPDLMVKFNRTALTSYIYHVLEIKYGNVTLTLSGNLIDGTPFEGSDTIKIIFGGDANGDGSVDSTDLGIFGVAWSTGPYNPNCDFNHDGVVDSTDYGLLATNYGATIP